jgi:gluconate 5-dehydrogenase
MDIRFDGKTCLVTGGTGAIGFTCAERLVESGAKVAIVGSSDKSVEAAANRLSEKGYVRGYPFDLSQVEGIPGMIRRVRKRLGEIDILVQSAGRMEAKRGEEIKPRHWDMMLNVNSKSLFFMMQAVCAQSMIPRQSGAIVNIASIAGIRGMGPPLCSAHYSASKGAAIQITRQSAVEWAPHHIRVNAVAPGGVLTERLRSLAPDFLEQAAAPIPMKRLSDPDDVANGVCFLASDAARMITGHVLVIDGGGSVVGI